MAFSWFKVPGFKQRERQAPLAQQGSLTLGAPAPSLVQSATTQILTPELFAKIKAIQIRTQRLVTDILAGDYESAFKGRGMEFAEVREYQPGDDVRHIDWNVTARMSAPYVKEHQEERELTVMLLVDVSSSGSFGSAKKLKHEVAAEVAAILAYTAIKSHDRVGLLIFSDRLEHYLPPKKGRAHLWRVIRDILTFEPVKRGTSLKEALNYLAKVQRKKAVIFLLSDFLDVDYAAELQILAKKHDVTAVSLTDPRELELPALGLIEFEDAETGEIVIVDSGHPELRREFQRLARKNQQVRKKLFLESGIAEISIMTDSSYIEPIWRFFKAKEP